MLQTQFIESTVLHYLQDTTNKFLVRLGRQAVSVKFETTKDRHDNLLYIVMIVYDTEPSTSVATVALPAAKSAGDPTAI